MYKGGSVFYAPGIDSVYIIYEDVKEWEFKQNKFLRDRNFLGKKYIVNC